MRVSLQAVLKSYALMLAALLSSCAVPHPQSPETRLEIASKPEGTKISSKYILECSGDTVLEASTLPAQSDVCARLNEHPGVLVPSLDPATPCTEIYGGPQRVEITGTYKGKPIDAEFSRTNGCLISQWNDVEFLINSGL